MRSNVVRAAAFLAGVALVDLGCAAHAATNAPRGLGSHASADAIAPLDIEVPPDGTNLPPGRATATDGAPAFRTTCAACHPGRISLARWPHATTLFDYVRRAMPPQSPRRLSPSDLYGAIAYLLFVDGRIGAHDVLDRTTLPKIDLGENPVSHRP